MTRLGVRTDGHQEASVYLKREDLGAWGSVKSRTAAYLVGDALDRDPDLHEVVESTSGNLGVAVAAIAARLGLSFTAVLDPKVPGELALRMRRLGARTITVHERDGSGSYLQARIQTAKRLAGCEGGVLWLDQYHNPANPLAHRSSTAPEILGQLGRAPGTIFVAVSTGGTARGLYDFFRAHGTSVVAVDVVGSSALGGCAAARTLTGVGSSLRSNFLQECGDLVHQYVSESAAIGACRALRADAGLMLGGSSGAVLAACADALAQRAVPEPIVCICPDGGSPYANTIYGADSGGVERRGESKVDAAPSVRYRLASTKVQPCCC